MFNIRRSGRFERAVVLSVVLAGCRDPAAGTVEAHRTAPPGTARVGPAAATSRTKPAHKSPDLDDLSPRFRGGENRP